MLYPVVVSDLILQLRKRIATENDPLKNRIYTQGIWSGNIDWDLVAVSIHNRKRVACAVGATAPFTNQTGSEAPHEHGESVRLRHFPTT